MLTRKILNAVSKLHSRRLVALIDKAVRDEQRAGEAVEQAEQFSRWADAKKQEARADLGAAARHTNIVSQAVSAELSTLPALDW